MLEDLRIAALNEIIAACREAADLYTTAASTAADAEIAKLLEGCAGTRKRFAEKLEASVRRLGGLPKEPDPERQGLENLWLRLKTALAESDHAAVAGEVQKYESDLQQKVDDALHEDLAEADKAILNKLKQDIARTLEAFEAGGKSD